MKTLNTELKPGRKYWLPAEKIIGVILLLWSMFVLYSMLSAIIGMFSSGYVAAGNTTFSSIAIKNHFIIIVSILSLFGSCLLLYKDKTGWMLCIVTSLMYGIILFMSSRSKAFNSKLPFAEHYKSYGIAALLFFIIFILLLLKPIREKYRPMLKTWLLMSGLILLLLIDKIIF